MIDNKINRVAIVGVGLIGGSLAKALRQANRSITITGYGRNTDNLKLAMKLGVIDLYETRLEAAVHDADLVVLAVPLQAMPEVFKRMGTCLRPDVIITDVGSAKGFVVEAAKALGSLFSRFVPAHPIAGTEQSGVTHAATDLFERHITILTPVPETDREALGYVDRMWQRVGSQTVIMDVSRHDRVLAGTSHLPHLLAFALVDMLTRNEQDEPFRYAAGGFRDFTRIASSDPVMWRDICLANNHAIRDAIGQYIDTLQRLDGYLEASDQAGLMKLFTEAKQRRDHYLAERTAMAGNHKRTQDETD